MVYPSQLPGLLTILVVGLVVLWATVRYLAPMAGAKCPNCSRSWLFPVNCVTSEVEVYHGGFDDAGDTLPPIIERTYSCPRCGYKRVRYAVIGSHGAASKHGTGGGAAYTRREAVDPMISLNPKELDWYQKIQEQNARTQSKTARFHSYDEWKAFLDGLKMKEREEGRKLWR